VKSLAELPFRPLAIMITAYSTAKVAVDAMKAGAYDYLTKPFEIDELRLVVSRALEKIDLERENRDLRKQIAVDGQFGRLLGKSSRMQQLFATADQVAAADVTVLIHGESGTGKELLAREMHERSPRKKAAFVAVNCAALPDTLIESELFGHEKGAFTGASEQRKGKFELAHGGTLFLDEIGDMNPLTQAKVLRAIEERRIERLGGSASIACDVRLISATHKDLSTEVEAGHFRQDLFYRLKVVTLDIPPLRQHREDLPLLIQSFVSMFAARHKKPDLSLSSEALERLSEHLWPGNVRELRNVIEGCVVLNRSGTIQASDLPVEVRLPVRAGSLNVSVAAGAQSFLDLPYKEAKRKFEVDYIAARLQENNGNVSRTAVQIGLHRQSLQQKLRELGIER
jgi:DNA-binding NtrC family response regulator